MAPITRVLWLACLVLAAAFVVIELAG